MEIITVAAHEIEDVLNTDVKTLWDRFFGFLGRNAIEIGVTGLVAAFFFM